LFISPVNPYPMLSVVLVGGRRIQVPVFHHYARLAFFKIFVFVDDRLIQGVPILIVLMNKLQIRVWTDLVENWVNLGGLISIIAGVHGNPSVDRRFLIEHGNRGGQYRAFGVTMSLRTADFRLGGRRAPTVCVLRTPS